MLPSHALPSGLDAAQRAKFLRESVLSHDTSHSAVAFVLLVALDLLASVGPSTLACWAQTPWRALPVSLPVHRERLRLSVSTA
jgi:hypothetical protein